MPAKLSKDEGNHYETYKIYFLVYALCKSDSAENRTTCCLHDCCIGNHNLDTYRSDLQIR